MVKRYKTVCSRCGGAGTVELSGVYRSTLEFLSRQRKPLNGAAVAKALKCKETAACNRLIHLERLGFAVGVPNGRERLWKSKR